MMGIKNRFYSLLLFCCSTISLAAQRDSISIDPRWNYWHVDAIAPNGEWAFVYQIYLNELKNNKTFAVHTDTKQKVEVTGLNYFKFTKNNVLIGAKSKETIEVDLMTQLQTSLGILKQKDWVEKEQTLCYITTQKDFVLRKYSKKGNNIVLSKKGIQKYYLNPSKTQILYQEEGNTTLYQLNLKTLQEKQLFDLGENLPYSITWNSEEKAIVLSLNEKEILFVDLEKGISKAIEIPKAEAPILGMQISFFSNDDFLIKYLIDDAIKDSTKDYLDIWNGNDRELKYKELKKNEGTLKAFVYRQSTNSLTELERSEKQDYLNIGISNYLLVYEPLELQDYSRAFENIRYRLLDLKSMKELSTLMTTDAQHLEYKLFRSPNNKHILYPSGAVWEVYDFASHKRTTIPHTDTFSTPLWTNDSKLVVYHDGQNLLAYNFKTQQTEQLTKLKGKNRFTFVNPIRKGNSYYIDLKKPFLFSIHHENDKTSYYSWFKNKITKLVDFSKNKLNTKYLSKGGAMDGKTVIWTEENYNIPPTGKVYKNGTITTFLEPELSEALYEWRKQKTIHYKDKHGVDLVGILWYPKDYNPNQKYPMVTWIYERQGNSVSEFSISTLFNLDGFNRALLNDEGYFVFMPDTYVSEEGAGLSALECVTKGIEVITVTEPAIDKTKIGLIGHSFGGYETSFILGNSNLFTAGVSGAGIHDLISFTYEFNYYRKTPNWFRVEGPQQNLKKTFAENPSKYYNNSPIHFAQNYTAPVLLWTGMEDYNVHWENTRHMYIALQRYKKPVIALFYKNESHSLSLRKEQADLTYRVLDWFGFYLKNKRDVKWINKGVDYNSY